VSIYEQHGQDVGPALTPSSAETGAAVGGHRHGIVAGSQAGN